MKNLIIIIAAAFSIFTAQDYVCAETINNGRDITRPLTRFDTSYEYQDTLKGHAENTFTIRTDRPFCMAPGWEMAVRTDLPCVLTNKITSNEPGKDFNFGLGDVLTQILLVRNEGDFWAFAAGTQLIFPTGTTTQMGNGKYQAVPTFGIRRMLPEISEGSFFGFLARYAVDYAGSASRQHINTIGVSPVLDINFPGDWFVETYPSQDIQVNFIDKGAVFIPFDIAVGKTKRDKYAVSLELAFPIYYNGQPSEYYTFYEFKTEATVSIFF
jgi:hypothetical protein